VTVTLLESPHLTERRKGTNDWYCGREMRDSLLRILIKLGVWLLIKFEGNNLFESIRAHDSHEKLIPSDKGSMKAVVQSLRMGWQRKIFTNITSHVHESAIAITRDIKESEICLGHKRHRGEMVRRKDVLEFLLCKKIKSDNCAFGMAVCRARGSEGRERAKGRESTYVFQERRSSIQRSCKDDSLRQDN
jgi:hypothetical protein